jgi:hypothetical protein
MNELPCHRGRYKHVFYFASLEQRTVVSTVGQVTIQAP